MLKRTTVKFLLAVLVITGLAGTANDASLTAAEKKVVVKSLKDSRDQLLSEYKKSSEKQAQFSPHPDVAAAAICIKNLQTWEENAWEKLKTAMQKPAPQNGEPVCASNPPESYSPAGHATDFKTLRQSGIRYVRNSTENFKTHYVAAEDGCVTGYQYLISIIERTNETTAYLRNIRQHPQFPAE